MFRRLFSANLVGCALLACSPAATSEQAFDPVAEDPEIFDARYPAENRVVVIPSGGARMNGVLLIAQGAGPHPAVVLLHGLPGQGGNRDLAETIRRAGWNVLTFQYRGAWGSEGAFSLAHVLEDAAAAVTFMRGPAGVAARSSPDSIVLIGHSMGGWAALIAAARDERLRGVASIAGWNVGRFGRGLSDPVRFAAEVKDNEGVMLALRGTTPDALTREEAAHTEDWDLVGYASQLARRPVLLVAGTRDVVTPIAENHAPLAAAFRQLGAADAAEEIIESDHAFTDGRVRLARALISWLAHVRGGR